MSNNAPDYENNLAFEPPLTWEQLVELVRKNPEIMVHPSKEFFKCKGNLYFYKNGEVSTDNYVVSKDKTPAQMQAIIKALYN